MRYSFAVLLLTTTIVGTASGAVHYTVTDLGGLGGFVSGASGINDLSQVVGYSYDYSNARRAFLYTDQTMTSLGTLGGASYARDINESGEIVGTSYTNVGNRAFLYSGGIMTDLGTLPGDSESYARAINDSGQIAGTSANFSYVTQAFLYSSGTMTGLGTLPGNLQSSAFAVNNNGEVAGISYNTTDDAHAYLYSNGIMSDLGTLGGPSSFARGINDSSQVVGYSSTNGVNHAFLSSDGIMTDLGTLGGYSSYARDINSSGQIVGYSNTVRLGVDHAFVYRDGAMIDLESLVDPASPWSLRYATAINDSGSIVGMGLNSARRWSAFLLSPIARDYPELSLPSAYSDLRMMQDSATLGAAGTITIGAPGNEEADFTLTSTDLTLDPASAIVPAAAVTPVSFKLGWSDTAQVGARTGSIELTNVSDPSDTGNHTMNVAGAVVADRVLTVMPIESPTGPVRIMARAPLTTTIASGNDPVLDSDAAATRVKVMADAKVTDGQATVTYSPLQPGGALLPTFNAPGQIANLNVTFAKTGRQVGSIDFTLTSSNGRRVKPFLVDGEAPSVGAAVQPAVLDYDVQALQQRRLRVTNRTINFGDVLRGANVSSEYVVASTNLLPDADHTTMVNVAPGGAALGALTASQTLIDGDSAVGVALTGTLSTYGKVTVSGVLPVATAEEASVQDNAPYKNLSVGYRANVGIAKFGTTPTAFHTGGSVLSARVAAGTRIADFAAGASLSSKVNLLGTLAANLTPAAAVTSIASLPASKLFGAVGSEAEIVDSTPIAADSIVTMTWRKRLLGEAYAAVSQTLPGHGWLLSDAVEIGGIAADTTYTLQLSFDNRISLAFDGTIGGSLPEQFPGLYLAEFDDAANQWTNAATLGTLGTSAQAGVYQSLAEFLTDNSSVDLADLQGSWGVDPSLSMTGTGHSWAVVAGGSSGIFGVLRDPSVLSAPSSFAAIPEPSTLALLVTGLAVSALALRRRAARRV